MTTSSRRSRRVVATGVAAAALLLSACGAADEPQSAPTGSPTGPTTPDPSPTPDAGPLERFYTQPVEWEPCRDGRECATVEVPLDYDDPEQGSIELALLRVPASAQGSRIGTLFVNPGGPGAPGTDYAAAADVIVSPDVRRVYDVVGFDPRGVGASAPVECVTDAELDESLSDGDQTPDTQQEVDELVSGAQTFREGCLASSPELLPHVGTEDVARDLDILRAVVGDERLTYMGKSYGTSIGVEYLRQFPQNAGRLLLDGVVDPALTAEDVLLGQAAGFEVALSRFVQACLDDGCALGSSANEVTGSIAALLQRLDGSPLPTAGRPLTESLALYGLIGPLYWPAGQGYPLLEDALAQAQSGDGTGLLALADIYLQRNPDGSYASNQWDVFTPVSCLDRPSDATPADVEDALPAFEQASPLFGESLAWGLLACTDWPVESDGLPAPVRAAEAPPVLVVGTTGDPATPYEWAVSLAEQLEPAVLLTYEGTPHTGYRKGSGCVDAAVDAYLLDGVVPADGKRCR